MATHKKLKFLPDIEIVKNTSQSVAVLDAIVSPEWEYRYYSFNSKWSDKEQMASMRDGSGDGYFIIFTNKGVAIKVFNHESALRLVNPPIRLTDNFPELLTEPAFKPEDRTYCVWRTFEDNVWNSSFDESLTDSDSYKLYEVFRILDGSPQTYKKWADEYYEKDLSLEVISHVYAHEKLNEKDVTKLNPDVKLPSLQKDLEEIGYPNGFC